MTGYVGMDPERVTAAADHLRDRIRRLDHLDGDVRRAALLGQLEPVGVLSACAEIDDELSMLATLLAVRASEITGFVMPGSGWDFEAALLSSLLDDEGAQATIAGPLALSLLVDARVGVVGEGDRAALSVVDLAEIAADPATDPVLAQAAHFLAANPFFVADAMPPGVGGHFGVARGSGRIPLADIERFLARNDMITMAFGSLPTTLPWSDLTDADLEAIGVDPEQFDRLELPRDGHDLTVAAIHHGTFTHSPDRARAFVATLPVHANDGRSIRFGAVSAEAAGRLYLAATSDLSSVGDPMASAEELIARWEVIAHLPETSTGTRNSLITEAYADIAHLLNEPINGAAEPADPDFRGHNWFHLGVVASASVRPAIVGDLAVYQSPISDGIRSEIANGNQAIFAHFSTELTRHLRGEPLDTSEMERAFELLDEAASTDDIAAAQSAMAESSALLALVEQHVVDPYLQLDGLSDHERLGTHVATLLGGDHRSPAEVMTDMGRLAFDVDGASVRDAIAIGAPIPVATQTNHRVDVEAVLDRLPNSFEGRPVDWSVEVAEEWSDYGQRMPIIARVAVSTLTDPALTTVTNGHRASN